MIPEAVLHNHIDIFRNPLHNQSMKNTRRMTRTQREFAGAPTADITYHIETLTLALGDMRTNGYADTHPAVINMRAELDVATRELQRRNSGGRVLADVRKSYLTDGECFAAGLEPADDSV